MSNKLEQLTNQLYNEGVEKANKEAKLIIDQAQAQAESIVKQAKEKADQIEKQAADRAKNNELNIKSELKMSSEQALNLLKQKITDLVMFKLVDSNVKEAMTDAKFVQSIIELSIKTWAEKNSVNPRVILSEKETDLHSFLKTGINKSLKDNFTIETNNNIGKGFQIAAQDGSYKLSFTDADFSNLIKSLLRKSTEEFLFN